MARSQNQPMCALSIAGLDPGGGAGLLADMRGFAAAGAFGCGVCAVLTVQSTSGLRESKPVLSKLVIAQATEIMRHQRVRAIKVGALGSASNVRAVGDWLAIHRDIPAIVDTVILPTRGRARLLGERAIVALRENLIPRAALVTANAPEAEVLTGRRVARVSDAHDAALALVRMGAKMALVKGGHLAGPSAIDVLATGDEVIELRAARLRVGPVHGTGCVLSSLVAGRVAVDPRDYAVHGGEIVTDALRWAKKVHHKTLAAPSQVGGDLAVLMP
jgi:hydroxymethylpyrimidine/phosphomethylpyrimidine kinase